MALQASAMLSVTFARKRGENWKHTGDVGTAKACVLTFRQSSSFCGRRSVDPQNEARQQGRDGDLERFHGVEVVK